MLIVSFVVFAATAMLPGDVAQILLGQAATDEAVAGLRTAMHLDDPAILRFLRWLAGLLQGDLGTSYANNMPVAELIGARLANTLKLAAVTAMVAVPVALFLGITTAMYRGRLYDRVVSTLVVGIISVPEFMIATLAVLVFAVWLRWLPALSFASDVTGLLDVLRAYAMPVITLAVVISAQMIRMTRAAVIETLKMPYVEMALLKGASRPRIVLRHALPNAIGPIVNAVALSLSYLVGGVIIVETIFNYPGIAKLMVDAVATRDLPLIQTCAMIFCLELPRPHHRGRHRRDPLQPEAAQMMALTLPTPRRLGYRFSAVGVVALAVILFWAVIALVGPWLTPYPPGEIVDFDYFGPVSGQFWLGTDYLGRDILSRILAGARYTVGISLAAVVLACASGVVLGMTAAVIGGWLDTVLSRLLDALNSIPSKLFGLVVVAGLGSSIPVLIGTLAVIYTPGAYRFARALAVNVNTMDFVAVARARGERTPYLIGRELLPNILGPVLADLGLRFVFIVLLLSGLSFLGLGVQPPNADWGSLVRENIGGLPFGAPAVLMPSLAIASLTISVNLLIDNLPIKIRDRSA